MDKNIIVNVDENDEFLKPNEKSYEYLINYVANGDIKPIIKPIVFVGGFRNGKSSFYSIMKNIKMEDELEPIENLFDW
ncbi:TPA: hypothetical protein MG581_26315 [Klebsiella pneumoniae]|nr:hypothetical protein [Klebsiella pneumoniae]